MRILLLGTGGTIASMPGDHGLSPAISAGELLSYVPDEIACAATARDLFALDSSNIQPEEWRRIAAAVHEAVQQEYEAVVITHGTDTLAYTASMLSFMLQGIPIPVVLTGSQYPIFYPDSDGRSNLQSAILAAMALPGGVFVCFGDRVILGCRSVKVRSLSLNAFESINYPNIGTIAQGRYFSLYAPPARSPYRFDDRIDPAVALIKLIPGTAPDLLRMLPSCAIHGVVIEGFGLGGVHNFRRNHIEAIEDLLRQGVPVILTTQCLYEYSNPDLYAVSSALTEAGVISAGDMTTEAAVTKLMWVLEHEKTSEGIRRAMLTDMAGEIGRDGASSYGERPAGGIRP